MAAPAGPKEALRRRMRALRRGLAVELRRRAAVRAAEALLAAPELDRVRCALLHRPVGAELPLGPLPAALRARGVTLALPRGATRGGPLHLLRWEPAVALEPDAFGVPAPPPSAAPVAEAAVDLVLVPALAVDGAGRRLGQGGGHYDRLLARLPAAWRVGWALARQRLAAVPAEPHDEPLHALATEAGLERFAPWGGTR